MPANGSFPTLGWTPIPDMQRLDADTSIFFLSGNGVLFVESTNDPWYQATTNLSFSRSSPQISEPVNMYGSDSAASPLGCINQYQFCRGKAEPNSSGEDANCGLLGSFKDAIYSAFPVFDLPSNLSRITVDAPVGNSKMASIFHWYYSIWAELSMGPHGILNVLGPSVLASQRQLRQGVQGALPDNQWQIDMTRLWNISLASMQAGFVDMARGPASDNQYFVQKPWNKYQEQMCANQVRTPKQSSDLLPPFVT